MTKVRSYTSAMALGSMTAAIALLAGISGASAQAVAPAPPLQGAGSFPGSFLVPGTQTSLHVGGVIQFDMRYQISGVGSPSPGGYDNANADTIALKGTGAAQNVGGNYPSDHGVFRMTAQSSRPNFETRTPTPYGEVKTYWEIDFSPSLSLNSGSGGASGGQQQSCCGDTPNARFKQGYGTLGPFLIGQTNSNFADLDATPDILDVGNIGGGIMSIGVRYRPQIRYTYLLPNGISLSGALEQGYSAGAFANTVPSPGGSGVTAGNAPAFTTSGDTLTVLTTTVLPVANVPLPGQSFAFNNFDLPGMGQKFPSVTGKARIDQPWGHAAFSLAVQQDRVVNYASGGSNPFSTSVGTGGTGVVYLPIGGHWERWGYMLNQTGHFNTFGSDKITWNAVYGQGAPMYSAGFQELATQWFNGLMCAATNATGSSDCSQPRVWGIEAGYSHWWTDTWRSGVELGYDKESKPNSLGGYNASSALLATDEKRHLTTHINLLWTPIPIVQLGLEYHWLRRDVQSGAHGDNNAVYGQAIFKF